MGVNPMPNKPMNAEETVKRWEAIVAEQIFNKGFKEGFLAAKEKAAGIAGSHMIGYQEGQSEATRCIHNTALVISSIIRAMEPDNG